VESKKYEMRGILGWRRASDPKGGGQVPEINASLKRKMNLLWTGGGGEAPQQLKGGTRREGGEGWVLAQRLETQRGKASFNAIPITPWD